MLARIVDGPLKGEQRIVTEDALARGVAVFTLPLPPEMTAAEYEVKGPPLLQHTLRLSTPAEYARWGVGVIASEQA